MATVVVVGSLNEDQTLGVEAIPAPGETVLATRTERSTGGKGANQAVAAARAGASVRMVGRVGQDEAGQRLLAALAAEGIDVAAVERDAAPSGIAVVVVAADGENAIVVAPGANAEVSAEQVRTALTGLASDDVVVAQGEVPVPAVEAAMQAASDSGVRAVLNLAPPIEVDLDQLHLDVLIVNEHEARVVGGQTAPQDPGQLASDLAARINATVVITLGAAGTVIVTPGEEAVTVPVFGAEVVDTTGAGDAFTGAFAAALAQGSDSVEAVRWGAAAGAIAVAAAGAQGGSATPTAIRRLIGGERS